MSLLAIIVIVHGWLSFLLFDPSIGLIQDDANYIMGAKRFLDEGVYPTGHGATFYHLVLTIPYMIFGPSLFVGKFCSVLWSTITLLVTFFTFRRLVSVWVLFGVLWIQATNFQIHFYGSSNMSESFFMMIQVIFVSVVLSHHKELIRPLRRNRKSILKFLRYCVPVLAISFLFSISKSIGIVAPITVFVYLLIKKRWVNGLIFGLIFTLLRSAYGSGVRWNFDVEKSSKFNSLFLKSNYHPDQGYEDLWGLIARMLENFNHHISSDFLRILGWRQNVTWIDPIPVFSVLFLLVLSVILWGFWRRKSKLLFLGIYLSLLASVTFVALQTYWKQDRMILVMIPLILLFIFDGAYKLLRKRSAVSVPILFGLLIITGISNLNHLAGAVARAEAIRTEYAKGNIYHAYTPDWRNFLKAVEWADQNLPEGSVVLCRKGNTASVFSSGRVAFHGRSRQTKEQGKDVLQELREAGVTHILAASLRIVPDEAIPGMVMGTIHSYVRAIAEYDVEALKIVHSTGGDERAFVFEINYPQHFGSVDE